MRSIDTNVLVRLLVRDDPEQVAAAEAFVAPGVWISTLVLAEAIWVVTSKAYRHDADTVAGAVQMLFEKRTLTFEARDVIAAALERFRTSPSISFSDCLILELAKKAGHLPLGTFDQKLSRLPGTQRL